MNYPLLTALAAELNALLAAALSPPATGWNPELRAAGVALSGDLKSASANSAARVFRVGAYPMRDSGCYALEIVPTFGTDASGCSIGLADGSFDFSEDAGIEVDSDGGWSYYATGYACHGGVNALIESLIVASGQPMRLFVDFYGDGVSGMIWLDTVADLTAADREAKINPHLTFPANTPLRPVAALYSDGSVDATARLTAGFSSGSYAAW